MLLLLWHAKKKIQYEDFSQKAGFSSQSALLLWATVYKTAVALRALKRLIAGSRINPSLQSLWLKIPHQTGHRPSLAVPNPAVHQLLLSANKLVCKGNPYRCVLSI